MRFACDLSPFAAATAQAARIAGRHKTIPILSHVRIAAGDGEVRVTATDLDRELEARFAARVERAGVVTAPGASLHDALRAAAKDAEVVLETDAQGLVLRTGRPRFKLPRFDPEDFPDFTVATNFQPPLDLDAKAFAADLSAVAHAISTEETRYYLNGVFFHGLGDKLAMVATDGHRLMQIRLAQPGGEAKAIVPADSVKVFADLAKTVERVKLELGDRTARLTAGATTVVTKLIDGTFPDYARVIPDLAQVRHSAQLDAEALKAALTRATVIASERGYSVTLAFDEDELTLRSRNGEGGEAEDALPFERQAQITLAAQARYLREALDALGAARPVFEFIDPGSPIRICDPDREGRLVIVMPTRG